jgi:hypothetical protein
MPCEPIQRGFTVSPPIKKLKKGERKSKKKGDEREKKNKKN